ncbi:hypothetical protein RHMOL_Rhmol09G0206400 [Rhododendron molle]|uniref:Uncharacterized protein n=1 Tax=Rhododendron molle TaxID=49168 RepID=A0ACC0MGZ4_RHOML|nr:hypothetical protein RHMOL_Rhmol09G0206400 [Rhododendron molle]
MVLEEHVKRRLELNDKAGIKPGKTYNALQIEAGGHDKVPYSKKTCRNHLDKQRRLRLVEGDAEAMHRYFIKMQADNSDFFFSMDLNDESRLRNVFWADARSRAACKEFGDVVTFDTTYLLNKHHMPFAPFVGVNHHGQSILLGCGLISREDTKSFSWLFETWRTCMGCAPNAIITDQCMAMKNAIENVFPDTRHRWCIWHIMKKLPEKLNGYEAHEKISCSMRKAVYDSLTIEQFEDAWDGFIKKYELQSNTWLEGMYLERKRWVPAYVKDVFWAGMSSTQRSEGMNAYFDGYVHAKTTLKQFVEQYENALGDKVESEHEEDAKSWRSYIPLITDCELEKQFQSAYTNKKFKEFHKEFIGKLGCSFEEKKEGEFEIREWVSYGEEKKKKQVPFTVTFDNETNEAHCNCRLFEYRGMVCKHQLMVWQQKGVERVPDKYVLTRWCKNVKRLHTRIRINYDKSPTSIETRRHDNMCKAFKEVVNLAEDSEEMYDMVMTKVRELKEEVKRALVSVVSESNAVVGPRNDSISLGDAVVPSKQSTRILDPEGVPQQGRPPSKRKQGGVEKFGNKKQVAKKKNECKKKTKVVDEIAVGHEFGTQESVVNASVHPSYMGQSMWPNMVLPNIAQGGYIFPFSPNLCPPGKSLNQVMPSFPSSQSNMASFIPSMPSFPSSQSNMASFMPSFPGSQSNMASLPQTQFWRGGQSSFSEDQVQERGGDSWT